MDKLAGATECSHLFDDDRIVGQPIYSTGELAKFTIPDPQTFILSSSFAF